MEDEFLWVIGEFLQEVGAADNEDTVALALGTSRYIFFKYMAMQDGELGVNTRIVAHQRFDCQLRAKAFEPPWNVDTCRTLLNEFVPCKGVENGID